MRELAITGTSQRLSVDDIWQRLTTIEEYPRTIKFCKGVRSVDVRTGGFFIDTTTLLWIPLDVEHRIMVLKPAKELRTVLRFPLGGRGWHRFQLRDHNGQAELSARIVFDLGNPVFNYTVGSLLMYRLRRMCLESFPELTVVESS